MEDGEEHSEAQESDSGFRKASKADESFRLCHGLYLKPVCPVRKLQVYFLYSNILQQILYCLAYLSGIYEYTLECKLSFVMQD